MGKPRMRQSRWGEREGAGGFGGGECVDEGRKGGSNALWGVICAVFGYKTPLAYPRSLARPDSGPGPPSQSTANLAQAYTDARKEYDSKVASDDPNIYGWLLDVINKGMRIQHDTHNTFVGKPTRRLKLYYQRSLDIRAGLIQAPSPAAVRQKGEWWDLAP